MGVSSIHPIKTHSNTDQLSIKADQVLAKQASNGDRKAFRLIIHVNIRLTFVVMRNEIEDVAIAEGTIQDSFIKAIRSCKTSVEIRNSEPGYTESHISTPLILSDNKKTHLWVATDKAVNRSTICSLRRLDYYANTIDRLKEIPED